MNQRQFTRRVALLNNVSAITVVDVVLNPKTGRRQRFTKWVLRGVDVSHVARNLYRAGLIRLRHSRPLTTEEVR